MTFCYRGAAYAPTVSRVHVTQNQRVGKYRGAVWQCHESQAICDSHTCFLMTYRGVNYIIGSL